MIEISERKMGICALFISITGISLLFFLTLYGGPKAIPISLIQFQEKDAIVGFSGMIESIRISDRSASMKVCDVECVTVMVFSSQYNPYLFEEGQGVFVVGKVREYKGTKTVSASKISIVE